MRLPHITEKYDILSIDCIRERRRLYLTLAKALGMSIIDGKRKRAKFIKTSWRSYKHEKGVARPL